MRRKFIALTITAVSAAGLAGCVSVRAPQPPVATNPPIVVDNYSTPTQAELYAQRYQTSVTQVTENGKQRFVICEDGCPGATPKTPLAGAPKIPVF